MVNFFPNPFLVLLENLGVHADVELPPHGEDLTDVYAPYEEILVEYFTEEILVQIISARRLSVESVEEVDTR